MLNHVLTSAAGVLPLCLFGEKRNIIATSSTLPDTVHGRLATHSNDLRSLHGSTVAEISWAFFSKILCPRDLPLGTAIHTLHSPGLEHFLRDSCSAHALCRCRLLKSLFIIQSVCNFSSLVTVNKSVKRHPLPFSLHLQSTAESLSLALAACHCLL